jgi:regulator of sigma E protease
VSWVLAFLGFAVLIILHEAGHFAAAKAVGMRVEKFSLFFGPWLWKVQRGETTYGIAAIPLGGYVKITGMNPAEQIPPEVAHRAYYRQPVWKRIVVIAAGPAVNFVLAFVILWGLYATTQAVDKSRPQRPVVESVSPESPAAGRLRPGDRIVAVDGVRGSTARLRKQLAGHRCAGEPTDGCPATEAAQITIVRDGREQGVLITPHYDAIEKRPLIGFSFVPPPLRDRGVGEAARTSVDQMWDVTATTVSTIAGIVYDKKKREDVGSVVGGYEATRRAIQFDTAQAFFILGLISLSLAVINLAPFLPLDGGHIFWALAEKVRGRAIPFATMEKASVVGMMLVLLLFFIGVNNDIDRLQDGTFDRVR